ncbi:MAG TPA: hypothetical protein VJA82_10565 [Sediminibacterium sp.]|uniref:hypothetical protein n=1 Tax=Sediminibacterium sp. TaxID=1917865 RepID=UPI0008D67D0E|nr:hypothetical protein [Sediminibacterium sp.]OHC85434.1 MAG: hypothetical protein A2472_06640 [Sphingobacteriia bacterium RIFOXYC2_FULL_35_18]OHC89327.1 MAG: hypothetical protein A2546_01305 [Sphingobacteriia bacterium RIFOXYD2_FULL_35_12]HLD53740.1 hypothetical protein [Sediminibacterium sp.]
MRRTLVVSFLMLLGILPTSMQLLAQDSTLIIDEKRFTLSEVVVRNNLDYKMLLDQIKEDTTFYKAFKNLRILGFSSYNDIQMKDKKGAVIASLSSKTRQNRTNGCRTMDVLEEKVTGDFYDRSGDYNYMTPELYASLFFTKGTICGETNIVAGKKRSVAGKKGMEKHKEQLKMLFFNPGKKISGIPFIGDKLDLYDETAHKYYDYRLDIEEYKGELCYVFSIMPKADLGFIKNDRIVVDQMVTWFNMKTMSVLARNYALSYKAGVYDFDVSMEVEMTNLGNNVIVPKTLRYKGNWDVIFKKRERAIFTATLFDFKRD